MPRTGIILLTLFAAFRVSFAVAQPASLLDQAIEENESAQSEDASNAGALITKADRLIRQDRFDEAVELYTRAYRQSPGNRNYLRLLVAKRAAGRLTADDREALDLIRQQEAGSVEQVFRALRLDILQAKQALRADDADLARTKTDHAEKLLESLPPYVDADVYRNKIRSLSRRTQRAQDLDPGRGSKRSLQMSDQGEDAYDDGEIINVEEALGDDQALDEDQARHAYDRQLNAALRRNRTDWILRSNEAALAPVMDMAFPADWPELVAKRNRYRDGVIYEGTPFTGDDGQTYFTAIYDLGDLVHPVPNFYASYPGTAREQRNQNLDRMYLRMRSQIFNGYPEDLAAGLPLLHFFGGIDNHAVSTRTDPYETARIATIIERFIGGHRGPAPAN